MAMIMATIPSIRSMLFFLEGFHLSAASFSMLTLPAIQRSTIVHVHLNHLPRDQPLAQGRENAGHVLQPYGLGVQSAVMPSFRVMVSHQRANPRPTIT